MTQATGDLLVAPRSFRTRDYFAPVSWPFWLIHLVAIVGVVRMGFSWKGLAVAIGLYYARMFFVCTAYHRYFSHRTFKTSRLFQFVLACCAQTTAQKGVLWWASHHRWHHKYSDQPQDVHSAKLRGFMYSHVGWILGNEWSATDYKRIGDLTQYPELRFLNHPAFCHLPAVAYFLGLYALGGSWLLMWGGFVSTVILWHGTFTINSLSHMFGKRRYKTTDESRNNWFLALVTLGEGWHNNHHHYQSSANQGFRWWEVDVTYYVLRLLAAVGLVWDLRRPPRHVLEDDGSADAGTRAAA